MCNCKTPCKKDYTLVIGGIPQIRSENKQEVIDLRDAVRAKMPTALFQIYSSCKCKSNLENL